MPNWLIVLFPALESLIKMRDESILNEKEGSISKQLLTAEIRVFQVNFDFKENVIIIGKRLKPRTIGEARTFPTPRDKFYHLFCITDENSS